MSKYRFIAALCGMLLTIPLFADEPAKQKLAWNYDEAFAQWRQSPRDPYLQYLVVQLGRRENKLDQLRPTLSQLTVRGDAGRRRASEASILDLFSGGLAVQESLQLDAMAVNIDDNQNPPIPQNAMRMRESVPLKELKGPEVQSHPWEKMLAGRKPTIDPLANCVPHDFYFAQFASASRMLDVMESMGQFGSHLFTQTVGDSSSYGTAQRIKMQLALPDDEALRPLYDQFVKEVAVTGSDLYINEGSDITLLFQATRPNILAVPMMLRFQQLLKKGGDLDHVEGDFMGVKYEGLSTPDRRIRVYVADPTPELHVRSNSLVALKRVIEAIKGKTVDDKQVQRLGELKEYAYMRTLMPRGAKEEDGFVYLSDPFIRRMVGPELRLLERRRQIALAHMRMIGYASLMFQTEFGRAPKSFDELFDKQCAPGVFGKNKLACPMGGKYGFSDDFLTSTSTVFGTPQFMTPCIELPLKDVTGIEADDYQNFVTAYSAYWRTFFDPIALRVQATDTTTRLETIILPLIDNSIYTSIAEVLGGKLASLDVMPVSKGNIATIGFKLNKQGWADLLPDGTEKVEQPNDSGAARARSQNNMKQIGLAMHNYMDVNGMIPALAPISPKGKRGLSWRVHLLPYIEQDNLYREFKLDEPWDSEHNKKLIAKIPPVYLSPRADAKLQKAGKTVYLVPVHKQSIFPPTFDKILIHQIDDGSSNTIMTLEVSDDRAVIWTKPDDLIIDLKDPFAGLKRGEDVILYLLADGSTRALSPKLDAKNLSAAITRNGGEVLALEGNEPPRRNEPPVVEFLRNFMSEAPEGVQELQFRRFIVKGLGDQVSLNVHDSARLFDFDWSASFGGGGDGMLTGFAPILHLLTCPVSIGIPVKDAKIVDDFLMHMGKAINDGRTNQRDAFFGWLDDYYTMKGPGGNTIHVYSIHLAGLRYRIFWGRIGEGFYIFNRPQLMWELADAQSQAKGKQPPPVNGHVMMRLRPENWKDVMPGYNLTWAENDRNASHLSQLRLANVARAFPADREGKSLTPRDFDRVQRIYGMRPNATDGSQYSVGPDGKMVFSDVHGDRTTPRQPLEPTEQSQTGKLMRSLTDATAVLTFTEDGLRAVITFDRKPK